MYKQIARTIYLFITTPAKAWKELNSENSSEEKALNNYAYPLIGIGTLAAFIAGLFKGNFINFQVGLKNASLLFITCFIGLYLAAFLIRWFYEKHMKKKMLFSTSMIYVVYSSTVIFIINFLTQLTDGIFFIQIFSLYSIYIAWEGASELLEIEDSKRAGFVLFSSLSIILSPVGLSYLIKLLMPAMQ